MFDFVLFSPPANPAGGALEYFEAASLPRGVFESSSDLQKARSRVKRCKYFHFQLYSAEQGFVKLMKKHGCTLVVALSDFFGIGAQEAARRLSAARVLVKIALKEGVRVRIATLARNENELRDEYEILCIGKMLGMQEAQLRSMRDEKAGWQI